MKQTLLSCLCVASTTAALTAQAADNNVVERNNDPTVTLSAARHPTTNQSYMWPFYNPPEYSATATTGVPANTLTWRWLPSETNARREARLISGFDIGIRPSAATATFPMTGYIPEMKIHVPRAAGTGTSWVGGRRYEPDLQQPALLTAPQQTVTFPSHASWLVSRTVQTPVSINELEIVMSLTWRGGEHMNTPGQQGFWGSYSDGIHSPVTFGFATPQGVTSLTTQDRSVLHFTVYEEQASISAQSDWGYRRDPSIVPTVSGYSIGTGQADLASASGNAGWDVFAGASQAGGVAVPLFNVGPIFPASISLFGQTLEVNPADPLLGLLAGAGYVLPLSATGFGNGAMLPFPALGSGAIGTSIGVEFLIANGSLSQFTESTQATWITITR